MQQGKGDSQTIYILWDKATGHPGKTLPSAAGRESGKVEFSEWRRFQGLWGSVRWSHFRMPGPGGTGKWMAPRLCWEAAHCTNTDGLWVLGQSSSWEEASLRRRKESEQWKYAFRQAKKRNKTTQLSLTLSVPESVLEGSEEVYSILADMQPCLHPTSALSLINSSWRLQEQTTQKNIHLLTS